MDGIHVLLVEDHPADIRLTREAFRDAGIDSTLHVVTDGEAAISFLKRESPHGAAPRPDLVLLDLNLPKKHGNDVLKEIKEDPELRSIPVVILTTSTAPFDVRRSYDRHANCYLVKPSAYEGFLETVAAVREFWLTQVQLPGHHA